MRLSLPLLAAAALVLTATTGAAAQDTPRVVTVNHALQYLTERLVGPAAEVVFPVPADVDPSFWRPSIADISAIQSADLIVLNGAGFASWVDRVSLPRARLVNSSAALEDRIIVTESITHSHGDGGEHSHEGLASYLWLDPALASAQAEAIAAALTARGIVPEDEVAPRLAALRADLAALDAETRTALAGLQDVALISTHPRYEYLAEAYGLTIIALEWEAGEMPGPDALAELDAMKASTGAQILIWEAAPPTGAFDLTAAIGLQNAVFPPLAHAPAEGTFPEAFAASVAALAAAAP